MMQRRNGLDRAAERLLHLDGASYGDERERAVYTEAATFGMTVSIYLGFIAAFVLALFGLVLAPILLIVFAVIPSYSTMWYAGRRGVQTLDLASRASNRELGFTGAVCLSMLLLTMGAMTFTGLAGQGVIPLMPMSGADFLERLGWPTFVGGAVGAVVGVIGTGIAIRQARNKRRAELDQPDTA